jgi:hypothetical protein
LLLVHWYIFTLVHCHVPCTHVLLHFCYLDLVKILVHLSPQLWDFIMCTLVHWYTGTLDIVYPGYIASGTLVHLYPGTLSCTMYPCTPPLLLLGLSQNFGTSFTPTLGFYYVYPGTLVHWYIGHCVPWVHCFWYIGTSLPWYIVMYHVPMYSSTFATWT